MTLTLTKRLSRTNLQEKNNARIGHFSAEKKSLFGGCGLFSVEKKS